MHVHCLIPLKFCNFMTTAYSDIPQSFAVRVHWSSFIILSQTKMAKWFHLQIRFLYKPKFLFSYSMQCLCTSPPSLGRQNTPCCASWQSVGTVNPPTLPWIHHTNLGKESIYVGTRCTVHPKNYEQCCNKNSHVYVYIYILYKENSNSNYHVLGSEYVVHHSFIWSFGHELA